MRPQAGSLVGALLALTLSTSAAWAQDPALIAVMTVIEHPNLDAVRDGVRDALRDRGYVEGENLLLI